MRTLIKPNGLNIVAKVPDEVGSMFDEDLFVEITDSSGAYPNGSYFNLTVNGLVVPILMWGGVGRYYIDNLPFSDFTKAVYEVAITAPFESYSYLFPKKSIGDVKMSGHKLLPFWNGTNTFSLTYPVDVFKKSGESSVKIVCPKNTKNVISGIDAYFSGAQGVYTEQYTEQYMIPSSGYYIECRKTCSDSVYFEWIDDDGLWRSWYFRLFETKTSSKATSKDVVRNISLLGNERTVQIDQKKNTVSRIFSSGNETKDILYILNSIKSSSYVFMGETKERVNIKSEDTTDFDDVKEFVFTVTNDTKIAI